MNTNEPNHSIQSSRWILETFWACTLVALIVAGRTAIEIPNFHPVMAVALLSGYIFTRRWLAVAVPCVGMVITDWLVFGAYSWVLMAVVYAALFVPLLLGRWMRIRPARPSSATILTAASCSMFSAVAFYFITNAAWWYLTGWYDQSFAGFVNCLAQALPFFKWTLASNLLFSCGLFGVYELLAMSTRAIRASGQLSGTISFAGHRH